MVDNPTNSDAEPPEEHLVVYFLVLLKKGPNWSPEVTPEVEDRQARHLAYIDHLHAQGKLLLAGPFIDSPVDELRGLFVLNTGSLEEAQALTDADPAVQAGRLSMEVIPWATAGGQLAGAGIPLEQYLNS